MAERPRIAVCAIMKQEAPHIVEWVAYHRLLGFDIIIADNGGDDGTSDLLSDLASAGLIRRLDFTWFNRGKPQFPAYRAMLRYARYLGYEFCGFIDCDEFFARSLPIPRPTLENGCGFITSVFDQSNASQVSFHWTCYGSLQTDEDENAPVIARFTHHSTNAQPVNISVKSFVRLREMFDWRNLLYLGPMVFKAHYFPSANRKWLIDGKLEHEFSPSRQISFISGRILHYQIKTWEEFQSKVKRGTVGSPLAQKYSRAFFEMHDYDQERTELSEDVRVTLLAEMAKVTTLLGDAARNRQRPLLSKPFARLLSLGLSKLGGHDRRLFKVLDSVKPRHGWHRRLQRDHR